MARIVPVTNQIYHVYNRGVDSRNILNESEDIWRLVATLHACNSIEAAGGVKEALISGSPTSGYGIQSLLRRSLGSKGKEGNFDDPLVRIIAYHIRPNHFHLLLEQLVDGGISELMQRFGGYTKYFNGLYERSGALFEGKYKVAHVRSDEQLIYLLAYVVRNDMVHGEKSFPFECSKEALLLSSSRAQYEQGIPGICDTTRTAEYVRNVSFWCAAQQLTREIKKNRDLDHLWLE